MQGVRAFRVQGGRVKGWRCAEGGGALFNLPTYTKRLYFKLLKMTACAAPSRCRANMAPMTQSRPDSGLGFQVKPF